MIDGVQNTPPASTKVEKKEVKKEQAWNPYAGILSTFGADATGMSYIQALPGIFGGGGMFQGNAGMMDVQKAAFMYTQVTGPMLMSMPEYAQTSFVPQYAGNMWQNFYNMLLGKFTNQMNTATNAPTNSNSNVSAGNTDPITTEDAENIATSAATTPAATTPAAATSAVTAPATTTPAVTTPAVTTPAPDAKKDTGFVVKKVVDTALPEGVDGVTGAAIQVDANTEVINSKQIVADLIKASAGMGTDEELFFKALTIEHNGKRYYLSKGAMQIVNAKLIEAKQMNISDLIKEEFTVDGTSSDVYDKRMVKVLGLIDKYGTDDDKAVKEAKEKKAELDAAERAKTIARHQGGYANLGAAMQIKR